MAPQNLLISIDGVSSFVPGDSSRRPALQDICWQVQAGGHTAIFGPNGAGKSSLLRLLAGELWPSGGRILWRGPDGMETSPLAGRALCALVSPAAQQGWQLRGPEMTGLELMESIIGVADFGMAREVCTQRALGMAEKLRCTGLLPRRVAALSQGQLRQLMLAAAMARDPAILLLDECLDGLDAMHRSLFADALAAYAAKGTVVMASHRPEHVPEWCQGSAWLEAGRLTSGVAPTACASSSSTESNGLPVGAAGTAPASAPPIFSLERVDVYVERHKVLHDINWQMRQGEHWRISGPNGSGKSTLLRLLAGDECAAAGGSLSRFLPSLGREALILEETRRGVRLVSDLSQALYGYAMDGLELVLSGLDNSIGVYRHFSAAEEAQAMDLLELFFPESGKATQLALTSIRRMSTGELRRAFLARALMGAPDVLLLDEPCSGLDAESRQRYLGGLERLAASRQGPALIFVSHEAGDAPACCTREACLEAGRLTILA